MPDQDRFVILDITSLQTKKILPDRRDSGLTEIKRKQKTAEYGR
jgi:hypothetical protein